MMAIKKTNHYREWNLKYLKHSKRSKICPDSYWFLSKRKYQTVDVFIRDICSLNCLSGINKDIDIGILRLLSQREALN